ncbi:MAG TPA: diguanylate cyclase [Jatrophihabitans sp.]|nr:diguanylate cyclase [Jatrophihabitans sp.]
MTHSRRSIGYLLVAVLVVAACLLYSFQRQRAEAVQAADRTESAVTALTALLDQETGLRGFLATGREEFLQPYYTGQSAYEQARQSVITAAGQDRQSVNLAGSQDSAARAWQSYASSAITARRQSSSGLASANDVAQALLGKKQMDRFRAINGQLRSRLDERRDATLRTSGDISTAIVVLLAALFALLGLILVQRSSRRAMAVGELELAYRGRQREFSDLVQAVDNEAEAHQLVQRHLQRCIPGAKAGVLIRNNSDNRLQSATTPADGSVLQHALRDAEPRFCLAIRLGRSHQDGAEHQGLLACSVCSQVPGTATCEPLLVSGKVIGAVLVEQQEPLTDPQRRALNDTVAQSAPVLANLKTIAIAENRAATDALTGLANRRAMNDTIKRMAAHAGRSGEPLSAIAFDLDHFKTVNDRYGHEIGDAALSAVGECLRENLRDSDFAARIGGEEFLVLAPGTDVDGALVLAEKLREALMREEVPQLLQPLTASFGVATIPHHAGAAELLLRRADRACYLAKDRGRNRVQVAALDDQPDYSMPRSPSRRSNGRAASATAAATAVGTEGSKTDGTM